MSPNGLQTGLSFQEIIDGINGHGKGAEYQTCELLNDLGEIWLVSGDAGGQAERIFVDFLRSGIYPRTVYGWLFAIDRKRGGLSAILQEFRSNPENASLVTGVCVAT